MLHPDTVVRTVQKGVGHGVFATTRIPKGTITWVLDGLDQILDAGRLEQLGESYRELLERYTYVNDRGERILCWDFARLMNHSCHPNIFGVGGMDFELAVRDIEAGEELTNDYVTLNLERPFRCFCGDPACRGVIRPEDFDILVARWDRRVRAAFPSIAVVPQPLWKWLKNAEAIEAGVADSARVPSIALNRCPIPASASGGQPPFRLRRR